ncbi:UDP-glucose 6-dehydrogenase, partial [bacterium]|nr:UDP-glucose 6-dehydrogenase [bacterium]
TDDMREAPSLTIIEKLLEAGARIKAYDPVAMDEARKSLGTSVEFVSDQNEALIDADALIVVTEWPDFRILNFKVMKKLMKQHIVFDGRNIYDPEEMKEFEFIYYCIGRTPEK